MSKVFVIPDVHLKPWMFDKAEELLSRSEYDKKYAFNYDSGEYEYIEREGFSIDCGEYVYNWDDSEYRREEEEEEERRREERRMWNED